MSSEIDKLMPTYSQISPITFKCKVKDCEGKATYIFHPIIGAKAMNIFKQQSEKLKPEIIDRITKVRASCDAAEQHRLSYNIVFFQCKTCDDFVIGTDEDERVCIDKNKIFSNGEAELTCINGHKNKYTI